MSAPLSLFPDDGSCMLPKRWKTSFPFLASVLQTFEMSEIPSHSGLFNIDSLNNVVWNIYVQTKVLLKKLVWLGCITGKSHGSHSLKKLETWQPFQQLSFTSHAQKEEESMCL